MGAETRSASLPGLRSDGPPSPQRHAVIDQSPAELDLHLFEAAQAGVDIPAGPLERSRQRRCVSSCLSGGTGRVRPDDERRVAEKAHAAEDRARRDHVDDCLVSRQMFEDILMLIARLRAPPAPA